MIEEITAEIMAKVEERVAEMLQAHMVEVRAHLPPKLKGAPGQINLKDFWKWVKPLLKTLGEDRRGIRPIPLDEIFPRIGALALDPQTYRDYLLHLEDLGKLHLRAHPAPLTLPREVQAAGIEHGERGFLYYVNLHPFEIRP